MKKLRLEIDSLVVESFDVPDASAGRGTVRGRESAPDEVCGPSREGGVGGCPRSYEQTCWWTGDPQLDCYDPTEVAYDCTDYTLC
jgi:hypothetical protein